MKSISKNIDTENIILIACNEEFLKLAIEGNDQLSNYINVTVPENWTQFGARALQHSLDKIKSSEDEQGWWSYLPIHKADNKLIGLCGYKGQPNENGQVEIGYEVISEYRNRGLATEIAMALIKNAFNLKNVNSVLAHTLGQFNASTKVLQNCGFVKIDEIDGKDLGMLWKWELRK